MRDGRRIAVLGAGAVGCYLGGCLDLAGVPVCLIGRSALLDPIRRDGLRLIVPGRPPAVAHPSVVLQAEEASATFPIVLLTVKSFAVVDAISDIRHLLGPSGIVVAIQNGVGSDEPLLEAFGPDRVVAATLTTSVGFDSPGQVRQHNRGGGIAWAHHPGGRDSSRAAGRLLSRSGLPVRCVPNAPSLRWSKLALNALGSALAAILDQDLRDIVRNRALFGIERLAALERLRVVEAAGIEVVDLPGYPVRLASAVMRLPLPVSWLLLHQRLGKGRGERPPGLRADLSRGGPTEAPYLYGSVVSRAHEMGIDVPVNQALFSILQQLTSSPADRALYRGNSYRLLASMRERGVGV